MLQRMLRKWHPTLAADHGARPWGSTMTPDPSWHPTMGPDPGTRQWDPTMVTDHNPDSMHAHSNCLAFVTSDASMKIHNVSAM